MYVHLQYMPHSAKNKIHRKCTQAPTGVAQPKSVVCGKPTHDSRTLADWHLPDWGWRRSRIDVLLKLLENILRAPKRRTGDTKGAKCLKLS